MFSMLEPFVLLLVLLLIVVPIAVVRFKYMKRSIEAFESIAGSLQKIAENKK